MKRLLLLRHAKASQDSSGGDYARPLAPRGRRDAPVMGKAMREKNYMPELVLCSGAARTRETWALAGPELGTEPIVEVSDALYLAPWPAILKIVKAVPDSVQTLLVVGHNPGMENCAAMLLGPPVTAEERARRAVMAGKFPTGALAVADCNIATWNEIAPGCGTLTDFIKPKELG